mmetsp:Transcript_27593/g.60921  ORF Transcript_27593/g.60921 Transcript_27593/m.60921 type:complete len:214 (+) Transcript_27593:145-786(+)
MVKLSSAAPCYPTCVVTQDCQPSPQLNRRRTLSLKNRTGGHGGLRKRAFQSETFQWLIPHVIRPRRAPNRALHIPKANRSDTCSTSTICMRQIATSGCWISIHTLKNVVCTLSQPLFFAVAVVVVAHLFSAIPMRSMCVTSATVPFVSPRRSDRPTLAPLRPVARLRPFRIPSDNVAFRLPPLATPRGIRHQLMRPGPRRSTRAVCTYTRVVR